ncbi:MAG: citrate transporter [Georgfuchsia sp.]
MQDISPEFYLFAATLFGVALFHRHTLAISLAGLTAISLYKIGVTGFAAGPGLAGFGHHLLHESVMLINLLCLLMGFALLSRHFEKSHLPVLLPKYLPQGWMGGFTMLVVVFVLSGFLDNIAGAMIGGAMAHQLFRAKVHIGYLAAIVAASNAGGAGSVVGDTTTTMMWIAGVSPLQVVEAYAGAITALIVFGIPAAKFQQRHSPMLHHSHEHTHVDWARLGIVGLILAFAMATNIVVNAKFADLADSLPFIGIAVWAALLVTVGVRRHDWEVLPGAFKGAAFLLSLVLCASMMPVEKLPAATWHTTFGLGFISSVFDNIPLTALALKQGGYDWGFLAYAVGFGGSMVWFGSSAGVALSSMYPEVKSVALWLRHGWFIVVGYIAGFIVMLAVLGWHPQIPHRYAEQSAPVASQGVSVE